MSQSWNRPLVSASPSTAAAASFVSMISPKIGSRDSEGNSGGVSTICPATGLNPLGSVGEASSVVSETNGVCVASWLRANSNSASRAIRRGMCFLVLGSPRQSVAGWNRMKTFVGGIPVNGHRQTGRIIGVKVGDRTNHQCLDAHLFC